MKKLLLAFMLVILALACKKAETETEVKSDGLTDRIENGFSFGECLGTCFQKFTFTNEAFSWETRESAYGPRQSLCQGALNAEQWQALVDAFTFSEVQSLEEVIGCPDCADGGAEWIEITRNGQTKKVTFDFNIPPTALAGLQGKLKALRNNVTSAPECQ